jgi:hypothetical protein
MPVRFGPRLTAFLDEPIPIVPGITRRNRRVQMNLVWFEFREQQIWLNGGPQRDWFHHIERDPRVTSFLIDSRNMFRCTLIQGRFADITVDGADEHIETLVPALYRRN